jgi:hypothetical protein
MDWKKDLTEEELSFVGESDLSDLLLMRLSHQRRMARYNSDLVRELEESLEKYEPTEPDDWDLSDEQMEDLKKRIKEAGEWKNHEHDWVWVDNSILGPGRECTICGCYTSVNHSSLLGSLEAYSKRK